MKNIAHDIYSALQFVAIWSAVTAIWTLIWYGIASGIMLLGQPADSAAFGSFLITAILTFIVVFVIFKAKWRKEQAAYDAEKAEQEAERNRLNAAFGQKQADFYGEPYTWYGVVYQPSEPEEPYVTRVTVVDEAENILRKGQ